MPSTKTELQRATHRVRTSLRRDPVRWARVCGIQLRPYQAQAALAIRDSILHRRGLTFVVVLPRQSGKNEVQRYLLAWLLYRAGGYGGSIVSVSPTFKPQTIDAMERVRLALERSPMTRGCWRPSRGFILQHRQARLQFFSGAPSANVVGATSDLLLNVDEAQDIDIAKFDKDFDPMTASTNATRVFWGTAWTSHTLLARQMRVAKLEQEQDGVQRLFFATADDVRALVPAYAAHLERVIREKGRGHPLVRTQYFCEEIDAQAGMFPEARRALMAGDSPARAPSAAPASGVHAFCIDVAGQDEARTRMDGLGNPGRDSTTLSIIEIDLATLPTLLKPTYRVVQRHAWRGESHVNVFGKLKTLAEAWRPLQIIIDATGVGEGLWSLLESAFPARVHPVKFTQQAKSELGYGFLAVIESGRFRDCAPSAEVDLQYAHCQSEILPGPQRTMRWGVPEGRRGPQGELIHDDFVIADALTAELDRLQWSAVESTLVVPGNDPIASVKR